MAYTLKNLTEDYKFHAYNYSALISKFYLANTRKGYGWSASILSIHSYSKMFKKLKNDKWLNYLFYIVRVRP